MMRTGFVVELLLCALGLAACSGDAIGQVHTGGAGAWRPRGHDRRSGQLRRCRSFEQRGRRGPCGQRGRRGQRGDDRRCRCRCRWRPRARGQWRKRQRGRGRRRLGQRWSAEWRRRAGGAAFHRALRSIQTGCTGIRLAGYGDPRCALPARRSASRSATTATTCSRSCSTGSTRCSRCSRE